MQGTWGIYSDQSKELNTPEKNDSLVTVSSFGNGKYKICCFEWLKLTKLLSSILGLLPLTHPVTTRIATYFPTKPSNLSLLQIGPR